jgi:hypothetical protein
MSPVGEYAWSVALYHRRCFNKSEAVGQSLFNTSNVG